MNIIIQKKSKTELYEIIHNSFKDLKIIYTQTNYQIDFYKYFDMSFGIYYKNGTYMEMSYMDIPDCVAPLYYNYFMSHTIDDVNWLYVTNSDTGNMDNITHYILQNDNYIHNSLEFDQFIEKLNSEYELLDITKNKSLNINKFEGD